MAENIRIKVSPSVQAAVRKQLEQITQTPELLQQIGEIARKDIIASITNVTTPGTGEKFANPTITKEWQQRKKRLSTTNTPISRAAGGGSSKASLSFTGEWLQSFKAVVTRSGGKNVVTIGPTGDHSLYFGVRGEPLGSESGSLLSNKKLGEYFIDQGRDWRGVTERIQTRIVELTRTYIRRQLTKQNK